MWTSPYNPQPTNRPNMAQVGQSEIYGLALDQQYTYITICTLLVYDTRKYSTRLRYDSVPYSLRD